MPDEMMSDRTVSNSAASADHDGDKAAEHAVRCLACKIA